MVVGTKVFTLDKQQGFISAVYADNQIDVDILNLDAKHAEDTLTCGYHKCDVVVCADQTPHLHEITPYGQVRYLVVLTDGIIEVRFENRYQGKRTLWLSDTRIEHYPEGITRKYANWADPDDFDALLQHYDLEIIADGEILPKCIIHQEIPFETTLHVVLSNEKVQQWKTCIGAAGVVESVLTPEGKKITTLEELRQLDVVQACLVSSYEVTDF